MGEIARYAEDVAHTITKAIDATSDMQFPCTGGKARGNPPFMGTINPIFRLVLPIKGNLLY